MSVMTNAGVAARWAEGLTGNWPILEQLSSPTMPVWHSHDDRWLSREEGAARISSSPSVPPSFEEVRTIPTATGFVVQATLSRLSAGRTHIVQICTVEDGLIASCEEYIAPETKLG